MLILKIYKWLSKENTVKIIHSQIERSLKVGLQDLKHQNKSPTPSKSKTRKKTSKHVSYRISGIYIINNKLSHGINAAKL